MLNNIKSKNLYMLQSIKTTNGKTKREKLILFSKIILATSYRLVKNNF